MACFSREALQTFSTLTQSSPERWCRTPWAGRQSPRPAWPAAAPAPSPAFPTSLGKMASSDSPSASAHREHGFWTTLEKHWTDIRVKAAKLEPQLLNEEFCSFCIHNKREYFISVRCTLVRCVRTLQEMFLLIAPLEKQLVAKSVKV